MALRTVAVVGVLLLTGCFRAPVPMTKLDWQVNPPARCLVLLLPGAGSVAAEFESEGFVKKLQASGLSLDVVGADATWGYYMNNSMVTRVQEDVLGPQLKAKKYEKTWVMGMSMGGFGTLFFSQQHPEEVDGMLALAPYLGDESLGKEIREAGGLQKWKAPEAAPSTEGNYQRQLWRWLQEVTGPNAKGPALYIGWGKADRLGEMGALVAEALPLEHVMLTEGGHDWPPWNTILERFLKEGQIAKECAPLSAAP